MDNTETYKEIVLSVIRHVLTGVGAYLTTKGFITENQANFLILEVAGVVFMLASLAWVWIKNQAAAKLANKQIQIALAANASTPIASVKREAKAEIANA